MADTTPARWYEASARPYPAREPAVHYPGHFEIRQVHASGAIKWRGARLYVSQALIGEPVGLEPVSERHWRLYFGPVPLGLLDDPTRKLLGYRPGAGRTRKRRGPRHAKLQSPYRLLPFRLPHPGNHLMKASASHK